jgi:hypothetical protein
MTTQTINGKEILMVTVPEDAKDFRLDKYCGGLSYFRGGWVGVDIQNIGTYDILGKASDLTEEQWDGIVEGDRSKRFKDYRGEHLEAKDVVICSHPVRKIPTRIPQP